MLIYQENQLLGRIVTEVAWKIFIIEIQGSKQQQGQINQNRMFEETFEETETNKNQHAPNNTLYVSNLNEKVPIDELKDTLFNLFDEYGEILDIIAKKNIRMRGQAFMVFKDINSAMEARRKLHGKQLYGKTLKVQFAKEKSDVVAKIDGTFQIRQKPENYFQLKFQEKFVKNPQQNKAKVEREKNVLKKNQNESNPPNHILFCQGINAEITAEKLTEVFCRYPGFIQVRLAPKNYAFIEYQDEFKAGTALAALNEHQLGSVVLKLSYAKK